MTTMTSQAERGLSRLADGTPLRDAVAADPEGRLGAEHTGRFGASTELLVKLLDVGRRLPVHPHPDRAFAHRHLGLPHACGRRRLEGAVEAILCRPPSPAEGR